MPLTDLTDREIEILHLLTQGLSNNEIAAQLFLAESTVKWYNSQIYSKLGVNNRQKAVEHVVRLNLLQSKNVSIPHNLPAQSTPFVGRKQELKELNELLLAEHVRLITILAPGGMGKTRLSLKVAHSQKGRYANGVYFVPLAPLSSSNEIVTTIADKIDFVFHGENSPPQQLVHFLKEQSMLLILDNFEHLLDGAELISDIIKSTPNIKIIVTSRERLNLRGESVYDLHGLEVPTWETSKDALEYDAARLFMQSAKQVRPKFELHANDLDFLARICRLTAGMPLGIELAAGWVDVLSLEQIASEIERGIDILETDMRDMPERHRSLRATFERTWNRLTDEEQAIFARLSVFRGGFTLESAEAIASANARHLRKLVQKALIQSEHDKRYTVHELLRQFAEGHLQLSGEMDTIQKRHAEHFTGLIVPLGNKAWYRYPEDESMLDLAKIVNSDFENVLAGWRFFSHTKDLSGLQQLLNGIWMYFDYYSRSQEAVTLFENILKVFEEDKGDNIELFRAQVNARRGWFYCDLGQRNNALDILSATIPTLKELDTDDGLLLAYAGVGLSLWFMGRLEEQLDLQLTAYNLANQAEYSRWLEFFTWGRTIVYHEMDRFEEALTWERSRPPEKQDSWILGSIFYQQGNYTEAEPYLVQSERVLAHKIERENPHFYSTMSNYAQMIKTSVYLGKYQQAKHYLKQALKLTDNTTYAWVTFEILEVSLDWFIAEANYPVAIEIVSIIMRQNDETGFVRNRAVKHLDSLKASVPIDVYNSVWNKGQHRDLDSLVAELLAELEDD